MKTIVEIIVLCFLGVLLMFGIERAIRISDDNYCSKYPTANYCEGVSLK